MNTELICLDLVADLRWHLVDQRPRQPLGPGRVHQHPRALQVPRAAKTRGKDEMAVEQCLGGAKFGQDFLIGHGRQLGARMRRFNALEGSAAPAYKAADFPGTPLSAVRPATHFSG